MRPPRALLAPTLFLAAAAGSPAADPPPEPVQAVVGGWVLPVSGPAIPRGTVIMRGPKIAAVGAELPLPAGAAAADRGRLIIKVARPEQFYRELPALLLELGADVERLETLDASVEAIFGYLVDGRPFAGEGRGE